MRARSLLTTIMLRVTLFSALVAVAFGGHSPHLDLVQELRKTDGARYSNDVFEDASLDVPGLVQKYGYPVEVHEVITSDGYILNAHRIPHGRDRNNQRDSNKPIVFLMHGLQSSSADFLVLGPGNALAYLLAEEGYDVWMGNARGNHYSRNHITLNPDEGVEFWKFSWDQIGNLDLPAFIDHALKTTGQSKLHYVGHSQGGTSFLVFASLNPNYNEKIISFQGLAPASFFLHNEVPIFKFLSQYETLIEVVAHGFGIGELLGSTTKMLASWAGINLCHDDSIFQNLCLNMMIFGDRFDNYNSTMMPVLLGHAPAGAAVRQIRHYGQSIKYGTFARLNHTTTIANLLAYGRLEPPAYDLSRITAPVYLHYGLSDAFVHYNDIYHLIEQLPNVAGVYQAEDKTFSHVEFIWGINAKKQIYDNLFVALKNAESNLLNAKK